MKRVTWFAAGVAAGAAGSAYATRKVKKTAQALKPANVARGAVNKVKAKGHDIADAVRDGRETMRAKEAEMKAERDGEQIVEVQPGQVIVLTEVRDSGTRRATR